MPHNGSPTTLGRITHELKHHAPFTLGGTVVGVAVLAVMVYAGVAREVSETLFSVFHPLHVLLSAIVTAGMYRLHGKGRWWATLLIGYVGSVGIGTLSDCLIPSLGELLFQAGDQHVHAHAHIGFIELWWAVNPLALLGAVIGCLWPKTKLPHAGHVLLSTAASLFHMTMAMTHSVSAWTIVGVAVFLFLAVWLPCCTSDIVFPLLLVPKERWPACEHCRSRAEKDPGESRETDDA